MNINENNLTEEIKRRIELAKLFYPLERKVEKRWGNIFNSSFETILQKFAEIAVEKDYIQELMDVQTILWRDSNSNSAECMFSLIFDITNLNLVIDIFDKIEEYNPTFTYAIVHQKKDGEGVFDIFRFSKFSYLEHCNRVRAPKSKKTND